MSEVQLVVHGRNLEEALANALTELVNSIFGPTVSNDASLALPLRAREPEAPALVAALLTQLTDEINEGAAVGSVQIDGLLKRDGDFVCWGYAFAAASMHQQAPPSVGFRELSVKEADAGVEIDFVLQLETPAWK